jgi:hypothetical protein
MSNEAFDSNTTSASTSSRSERLAAAAARASLEEDGHAATAVGKSADEWAGDSNMAAYATSTTDAGGAQYARIDMFASSTSTGYQQQQQQQGPAACCRGNPGID